MGFLSSMLPTIVGVGVGAATGNPMLGAAAAGGLGYAQSGSLKKGLMAGIAGYGGAGLGEGLASAGEAGFTNEALKQAGTNLTGEEALAAQQQAAQEYAQKSAYDKLGTGIGSLGSTAGQQAFMGQVGGGTGLAKAGLMAAAPALADAFKPQPVTPLASQSDASMGQRYSYSPNANSPTPAPDVPSYQSGMTQNFGRQQRYFNPTYNKLSDDQAKQLYGYADGGVPTSNPPDTGGGPVEQMSNQNAIGANTGYPMADINHAAYATPWQTPTSENVVSDASDTGVDSVTGEQTRFATGGIADAHYNLGGYSDGGRLLKGPGDGVSDSIPAVIGHKQPARLADGEFVVPARIVSELGNGSTEAGARKLYAMMDRVQKARGKTTGKNRVATNTKADKYLPA